MKFLGSVHRMKWDNIRKTCEIQGAHTIDNPMGIRNISS